MKTYIIIRRNHWGTEQELEAAGARSAEVGKEMADGVRWIRTYALGEPSGKLGTICVYQAVSEEMIREHADCADLPVDEIIPVAGTMIINPDPAE